MSELQFPKYPIIGQEYDFPPYRYYWDGIKWKTKGIGYNPVNDLRDELEPRVSDNESKVFEALRRSYADAGYLLVNGSFEKGGTLTSTTDVLLYKSNGRPYSYAGTLPHTVATGSSPSTEPGMWVDRSDVILAELLAGPSGVNLVGGAASEEDITTLRTEDVISELGGRAMVFNRQAYELCRVSAPTSAPANAGYNQGIFVRDIDRLLYVTYDPDSNVTETGTKYIGKYNLRTSELISECAITDPRVGHLDGIFVDGLGIAYVAGRVGHPAILKIDTATGAVIETLNVSMTHTSQMLIAVDTSIPDEFILWGRFGGDKIIVRGKFSEAVDGVIPVTATPIAYPQSDILQGLALLRERVYTLTGSGGLGLKLLTEYRLSTGESQASVGLQPNSIFSDQLGGQYEPEGLCIFSDRQGTAAVVNIYIGWVFGDGTKANGRTAVYKYAANGSRQVPSVDYYAGRALGSFDYQIKDIVIRLRYGSGVWAIESGDYISTLTQNSIRNLAISGDSLSITFDLVKSYQDVLGWYCDGSSDLIRFGRVKPVWVFKEGGGTSNVGHQIRLVDLDSGNYKPVNSVPLADGQRLSLMLRVIE